MVSNYLIHKTKYSNSTLYIFLKIILNMEILMPGVSRVTDIGNGTCSCHSSPKPYTTTLNSGCSTVIANNLIIAIVGSSGSATCGHGTTAQTGSGTVFACNKPVHRIGDSGANCGPYTMSNGSGDVIAG